MELVAANWLPVPKDFIAPLVLGSVLWLSKWLWQRISKVLHLALKGWVIRDRKRIRTIRRNPISIQRQLSKEAAIFAAFLITTVISYGVHLTLSRIVSPGALVVYFFLTMLPVLVLEWWWLIVRSFNEELLRDASRLSPGFKLLAPKRIQSDRLRKARKARQIAIKESAAY